MISKESVIMLKSRKEFSATPKNLNQTRGESKNLEESHQIRKNPHNNDRMEESTIVPYEARMSDHTQSSTFLLRPRLHHPFFILLLLFLLFFLGLLRSRLASVIFLPNHAPDIVNSNGLPPVARR